MNKYLAIIDIKTISLIVVCIAVTFYCFRFDYSYDLSITLFSIAIIFPLVFTIREAFKRRDNALKFLSMFKASINVVHHSFENNKKLSDEAKAEVTSSLNKVSTSFLEALKENKLDAAPARKELNSVFSFVKIHREEIALSVSAKLFRVLQDAQESMENTFSIKMHGTPISLRAYCLVFIYIFPIVFTPSLVYTLSGTPPWVVYFISVLHGFILISLYNVQEHMEDPFDQVGLDDIKIDEFHFRNQDETYSTSD